MVLFVTFSPDLSLFAGLVSDELMLKIIQSELDKLHGKASPPSLFFFIPFT
jgi:hypothetical protein